MSLRISASSQQYLADLALTQQQLQQASSQVSSGMRLSQPSDDPVALSQIYQLQSELSANQQTQSNLQNAQTVLNSADSAVQNSVSAVESALSISSQAINTLTPTNMAGLAEQVAGIQQTVVGLSQTSINGVYIFSGDLSTQPQYQYDATQPEGVQQLTQPTATQVIDDASGNPITTQLTAQQIFDARDAGGAPTTGNVFAALNDLHTALVNGDTAGVTTANTELTQALSHLNQQLSFYGQAENRVTSSLNIAQKFQLSEQSALGNVQNADIPTAALALSQAQTQQQATLSVEAKIEQMPTLFSYLG